jgi:lipopolysaccharide/colanic/teichoic acid biosynthesis glycosyltransferase
VHGGQRLSVEEKIALDNWYLRNAGLWIDLRIVCRTLRMMVLGKELRSDQRSPKVGNYKI